MVECQLPKTLAGYIRARPIRHNILPSNVLLAYSSLASWVTIKPMSLWLFPKCSPQHLNTQTACTDVVAKRRAYSIAATDKALHALVGQGWPTGSSAAHVRCVPERHSPVPETIGRVMEGQL